MRVSELERFKKAAEVLWSLLDDIDTASDMFKPSNEAGYKAFYDYAMRKAAKRGKVMQSLDGYSLSWCPEFDGTDQHNVALLR